MSNADLESLNEDERRYLDESESGGPGYEQGMLQIPAPWAFEWGFPIALEEGGK